MSLSAASIESVISIAGSILDRYLKPTTKRQFNDLVRDELVSIGLATGYFFNFLDMTAKTIQYTGSIEVFSSTKDGKRDLETKPMRFLKDNIKVEIIMPKRLQSENFAACEREFELYKKGFFYSQAHGRYYGINYSIMETSRDPILRIVDYARPVIAAKPFYEQVLMVATEAADTWEKTQVAEIAAFKKTLDILLNRSYGTLPNKLNYMDIG